MHAGDRPAPGGGASLGHARVALADLPLERVNAPGSFLRGWWRDTRGIWPYRELLQQLVRKELKVKYKESVLGFFWTMARPLLQIVIYYVAFTKFLGNTQNAYAVFLFAGLIAWTLFTDVVNGSTGSIVGNGGLIKKTYFPREIFPLSVVGAALVNFAFQLVVLMAVLGIVALSGEEVRVTSDLLLVPPALAVALVWGTALGLVLAASTVYLRDLQHLIDVVLLAWFWMTPIVYPISLPVDGLTRGGNSLLLEVFLANPMVSVVAAFQRAFYTMGSPDLLFQGNLPARLAVQLAAGCVLLWLGQRLFARLQGNFAQEL